MEQWGAGMGCGGEEGRGAVGLLPFGSVGLFAFYTSVFFAALLLVTVLRRYKRTQGTNCNVLKLDRLGLHSLMTTGTRHLCRERQTMVVFRKTYSLEKR